MSYIVYNRQLPFERVCWCGRRSVSPLHNMAEEETVSPSQESYLASLAYEIFTSPLNLFLLGVCAVLIYKILRPSDGSGAGEVHEGLFSPLS